MARFTNVGKARKRLLMGACNQRLYQSALAFATTKNIDADNLQATVIPTISGNLEELGAGEGDMQLAHRTRCARLNAWLGSHSFKYSVAISEVVESSTERLQYAIFGRDKSHLDVATAISPTKSPIVDSVVRLSGLLCQWTNDKSGPWKVLPLTGIADLRSEELRLAARANVLHLLAGLVLHFDRKFSSLPWSLFKLASEDHSKQEKAEVCQLLVRSRACNLPLFAREFLHHYPTPEQMQSAEAVSVIRVWASGKRFSTKGSELGHASERRFLSSAGAPGKAMVHHARKHLLHKVRLAHMERHGADPLAKPRTRGKAKATHPSASASGDIDAKQSDPFHKLLAPNKLKELDDALEDEVTVDSLRRSATAIDPKSLALRDLMAQPLALAMSEAPLPGLGAIEDVADHAAQPATKESGKGLNPYFVHLNRCRREFKASIGNRPMTPEEQLTINQRAKESWNELTAEEKGAIEVLYQSGVRRRQIGSQALAMLGTADKPYTPNWNMGTRESVINPESFAKVAMQGAIHPVWGQGLGSVLG